MTIAETISLAKSKVIHRDFLAIEVLLAFVLGKEKDALITLAHQSLSEAQEAGFWSLLERFNKGEPVAYLINNKEFYGLNFYVDKRVLIPRPETELLVEIILNFAKSSSGNLKILDVGTGSGCIAITLAKKLPTAVVTGIDISEQALEVAQKNCTFHKVDANVCFGVSDLLKNIDSTFDIIVANLPYIGKEKYNFVSKETKDFEPHVALFGGDDGLKLYEELFEQLKSKALRPKLIIGEFGFLQADAVKGMLNKFFIHGSWRIVKDLASIERVFMVASSSEFLSFYD